MAAAKRRAAARRAAHSRGSMGWSVAARPAIWPSRIDSAAPPTPVTSPAAKTPSTEVRAAPVHVDDRAAVDVDARGAAEREREFEWVA